MRVDISSWKTPFRQRLGLCLRWRKLYWTYRALKPCLTNVVLDFVTTRATLTRNPLDPALLQRKLIAQAFDGLRCLKNHVHRPVLGGSRITSAAGIYPRGLAKALVSGIEAQFVKEFKTPQEVLMTDDGPQPELPTIAKADHSESEEELVPAEGQPKISAGVKVAVKKLHEATGHRDNKRLARALVLAGSPS